MPRAFSCTVSSQYELGIDRLVPLRLVPLRLVPLGQVVIEVLDAVRALAVGICVGELLRLRAYNTALLGAI